MWLKTAMTGRFRSFGELAEALHDHPDWPKRDRRPKKQLVNILGGLNRGERRTWLTKPTEAHRLRTVATLLDLSPGEVQLRMASEGEAERPRVPLVDLPGARGILLDREDLFPGIPQEVLEPETWGRCWWPAGTGSGRTLAGRWLEARGKACFIRARSWQEAQTGFVGPGPFYVELQSPPQWISPGSLPDGGILVATPGAPPPERGGTDPLLSLPGSQAVPEPPSGEGSEFESVSNSQSDSQSTWTLVPTPEAGDWLAPLLEWVRARLPAPRGFTFEDAIRLFEPLVEQGLLPTPGDALSLVGLLDEYGVAALAGAVPLRWAVLALERRLERFDVAGTRSWAVSATDVLETMQALVQGLMLDERLDPSEPRKREVWAGYLERCDGPPSGSTDLLEMLPEGEGLDASEVERIRRALVDPSMLRIRALMELRLLEPAGADCYRLGPVWIKVALVGEVIDRAIELGPRHWGEFVLRPAWSALVVRRLARSESDVFSGALKAAVAEVDSAHPSSVAAVQVAFLLVGLGALGEGVDGQDVALLHDVWRAQMDRTVRRYTDVPRVPCIQLHEHWEAPRVLRLGTWFLAALAISEGLPAECSAGVEPALCPWELESPPEAMHAVLGHVLSALVSPGPVVPAARWTEAAYQLGSRLYRKIGPVWRHGQKAHGVVGLMEPAVFAHHLAAGTERPQLSNLGWSGEVFYWKELQREGAVLGLSVDALVRGLWDLEVALVRGQGTGASVLRRFVERVEGGQAGLEMAETIWKHATGDHLKGARVFHGRGRWKVPLGGLSEQQCQAFVEVVLEDTSTWMDVDEEYWATLPDAAVAAFLMTELDEPWLDKLKVALWRDHLDLTASSVRERLDSGDVGVFEGLMVHCPADVAVGFLPEVRALSTDSSPATREVVLRWCHRVVARRPDGWRDVYRLLMEMLRPVAGA